MAMTPIRSAIAIATLLAACLGAGAQEPAYPDRPITMIVTFAAGGSSDVLARTVAEAMSRGLGLSLSYDIIVKQHAGSIEVDTQPGEFTEFRVVLPRRAATIAKSGERN